MGYICRDPKLACNVWFCASDDCLRHDSLCSKAIARGERLKEERLKKGACPFEHLPIRFQLASLAGWEATSALMDNVRRWMNNPIDFLTYIGPTNTGKTFFSCAAFNWMNDLMEPGKVCWIDGKRLKSRTYAAINDQGYFPVLQKFLEYDVIIFDEIAEFSHSEWQKEVITIFMDMLYENAKTVIVTSSLNLFEIGEKISPKIASRFRSGKSLIVDMVEDIQKNRSGG